MKIVVLDTEGRFGNNLPWQKGYYMSCCGVVTLEGGERSEEIIWFDHNDMEATVGGAKRIQSLVDVADLLVFHNAKYDISVLRSFGIRFCDTQLWCTMITDYLIEGQNKAIGYKLDQVAERYELEQKDDKVRSYWDRGVDTYDIPAWILGPYCLQDCHVTLDIYLKQVPRVEEAGLWKVVDLQNEYTYVLEEMETNGLYFNKEIADEIVKENMAQADAVKEKILKGVPNGDKINLSSHQQLSALLYGGLLKFSWEEWTVVSYKTKPYSKYYEKTFNDEIEIKGLGFKPNKRDRKKDGYYKVDKLTIQALHAHTVHQRGLKKLLVEYSALTQAVKSLRGRTGDKGLVAKLCEDGCIHPNLNQTITATGRLTSSNPNGQNLPRGNTSPIKTCFIPRYDGIMQVDLSQVEWRDAAWLSQDKTMIAEINGGVDQHIATGEEMFHGEGVRTDWKVFNFRMIFGGTEWGFYLDINMPRLAIKKWKKIIGAFWNKYWGLEKFHANNVKFVYRHGYLKLLTGRWFKFNKKHLKGGEYGYAINQIKNYPIQGMSGGDILPLMAVIIRRGMRNMGLQSKLVLTVHDSIVFDYVEAEREKLARLCYRVGNSLGRYIQNYYGLDWNVDLEVEVETGINYGAMKYLAPKEVGL